jgi:hypothetical protein
MGTGHGVLLNSYLKLARVPTRSLLPSQLYLDHSHCPVLAPATLAALPSTRAIPDRDVFYVAHASRSIETRSLPTLTRSYSRRFTFYLAHPIRSILPLAFACARTNAPAI